MSIEEFRKFIKENGFHCIEIYDRAAKEIFFCFEVKGDKKTVCVTYDANDRSFIKANTVMGDFASYSCWLESMLLIGQCAYITHYKGERVIDFAHYGNDM